MHKWRLRSVPKRPIKLKRCGAVVKYLLTKGVARGALLLQTTHTVPSMTACPSSKPTCTRMRCTNRLPHNPREVRARVSKKDEEEHQETRWRKHVHTLQL